MVNNVISSLNSFFDKLCRLVFGLGDASTIKRYKEASINIQKCEKFVSIVKLEPLKHIFYLILFSLYKLHFLLINI